MPIALRDSPTDQPVIARHWSALHLRTRHHYRLYEHAAAPDYTAQCRGAAVVSDHGELVLLHAAGQDALDVWQASEDPEESAWQQLLHEHAAFEAEFRATRDAARTRDLLRPPPVTAEIVTEPDEHPLCVASVVVGADPRIDSPLYSLQVSGEVPLLVTHAQLAALMLAAQQLCAECTPTKRSRLQ